MKIDLKEFRQKHGLFQSDLSEILHLNQSNISRAEIRGYLELTALQRDSLYEKFGKEDVDSYAIGNDIVAVNATSNTNEGDGIQNNGYMGADAVSLSIIRKQSEALTSLAEKQAAQTDRLLNLLEKLSEKL